MLGGHVIMGFYGFWLPNYPRGSWSDFVGSWELYRLGGATKVSARMSLAHREHDVGQRLAAKAGLKHPPVRLTSLQARAVADGLAEQAARSALVLWACAILPDHVHLVLAEPAIGLEQAANLLKGAATRRLLAEGLHPLAEASPEGRPRSVWARRQWMVFLHTEAEFRRAIQYVEDNPEREGLRRQRWSFVQPFPPARPWG